MIKKDISNKYNIYENQLTLESHSYNESNEQMQYVFHTRYDRFISEVRDGKIMKKMKS